MGKHFRGCRSLGRIQAEKRGEERGTGGGEEGKFGADDGTGSFGVGGGETEGFGVWETAEGRPGFFGGDAAEFEDLCWKSM